VPIDVPSILLLTEKSNFLSLDHLAPRDLKTFRKRESIKRTAFIILETPARTQEIVKMLEVKDES